MPDFTHLHLHTQYSLLDGAIRLDDLFPRLLEQGMRSVAMTDHGNLFGAVDFYKKARRHGVKPIFGCEVYIAPDRFDRQTRRVNHLILLARNQEGYRNLTHLVSLAHLEGFYYHPRIDKKLLHERRGGIVALSACLGGEVAHAVRREGVVRAREVAAEYRDLLEPGAFHLELQPNGMAEQEEVNAELRRIGRDLSIPLVCTNDCHYLNRRDARAHEILMCIQMGKSLSDDRRMHHRTDAYYLKTPAEMEAYFHDIPEVLENAARLGDLCNVELDLTSRHLPRYQVPEGHTLESYLGKVAQDGLEARLRQLRESGKKPDPDLYRQRLAHELDVIQRMGFAGYFLIVWDFIDYARRSGVPVGPGRGSGAGSLVAYALFITGIDPVEHKLLFERFLNPERVSMPDFDIDFCMNRRDEVIRYVSDKYGRDNVGQIVTMHQLKARAAIKDVARVMGLSFGDADRLAKLIPEPVQGKTKTIRESMEEEPRLKEIYQGDERTRELLDVAIALEGLNRHAGVHAAGVVIAEKPLWEYVPCFRDSENPDAPVVTQFSKKEVELAGLVKFDFLGLKTLTILDLCVRHINAQRAGAQDAAPPFRLEDLALDDAKTYQLIAAADTTAVFQMESSGFREMLKRLRPDRFEDIVAAVALYRPGPMDWIDDFVRRKHGQVRTSYPHPALEPILRDTYGIAVYQEQVMQIAAALAGFSLGQADMLRRAMGEKKKEAMAEARAPFVEGCAKNGIDARKAGEIFDLVQPFAGYAFNRSHAAGYALLAYQTAYLKAHYPVEFMAAVLSCEQGKIANLTRFIAEARAMGIDVRRPDVNESERDFAVVRFRDGRKVIRFGLGPVKSVGDAAVTAILDARRQGGEFTSLLDFCERVDQRRVNRKVIEALVKAGAFDGVARSSGAHRASVFATIERAQELAGTTQRDRETGQRSLLGLLDPAQGKRDFQHTEAAEWTPKELLAYERENLGFYVTGHPLDRYEDDLRRYATATTADLESRPARSQVSIGGVVAELRERLLKSGRRMAFFALDDGHGQVEVVCFPVVFERVEAVLRGDDPILCTGTVQMEGDEGAVVARLHLEDAVALATARQQKTRLLELRLNADALTREELDRLGKLLGEHRGECAVTLRLQVPGRSETVLSLPHRVSPTDALLLGLERMFGERVAVLR
jgi:DNA polymerase III subunit alpha